jgi:transcriptional regulator with XRE-family HTH domain
MTNEKTQMKNNGKAAQENRSNETASNFDQKAPFKRAKPTLREKYFLERELIRREIGGLDQIREQLGLSQRRLCQLLLVDPSAWTRWVKSEAPPHIYQALRWLTMLKKVSPDMAAPRDLASRVDLIQTSTQTKFRQLEDNVALLERELAIRHSDVQVQDKIAKLEERLQSLLVASVVAPPEASVVLPRKMAKARKKPKRRARRVKAKSKPKQKPKQKLRQKRKLKSKLTKTRRSRR